MNYFISVIVPLYRVEAYVERCVRSLFEQSLHAIEYIFVDDCGGDGSMAKVEQLLEEYPQRKADVRFLHNACNTGSATSRNRGLAHASGYYIAFCDGDDWMEPNALEQMFLFARRGNYDLIWTDFYFNYPTHHMRSKQVQHTENDECIRALLTEKMHGALWNKLYKRSLFEKFNIKFNDGADLWEDLSINIQLFYHSSRLGYLDQAFYHYEQSSEQSISRTLNEKAFRDMARNLDAMSDFLRSKTSEKYSDELLISKLAAKQTLLLGSDLLSFKQWKKTYPESNKSILQFNSLPIHLRILGWCSTIGLWPMVQIWLILKRIKHKSNTN